MTVKLSNNATSRLATSISSSDTTIVVQAGEGAKFPTLSGGDTFPITMVKADGSYEIGRCTARSSDTLTITRGQEGVSAKSFSAGDRIELRLTEGAFEERLGEKFDKAGGDISGPITLKGSGGMKRWEITLPDSASDDLTIKRFDDAGLDVGDALKIKRATGAVQVRGSDDVRPLYIVTPTSDKGEIDVAGVGPMKWDGTKYVVVVAPPDLSIAKWIGTPIGGYITPFEAPPTDDPNFRYVLCTAGQTGSGGYNEGVLINESVTGTAPLVMASAKVSLTGSPMDGITIPLINTERRFVGAGEVEALENDSMQRILGTFMDVSNNAAGTPGPATGAFSNTVDGAYAGRGGSDARNGALRTFDSATVTRTSDHNQPRTHRLPHYRRIL